MERRLSGAVALGQTVVLVCGGGSQGPSLWAGAAAGAADSALAFAMGEREIGPTFRYRYVGNTFLVIVAARKGRRGVRLVKQLTTAGPG